MNEWIGPGLLFVAVSGFLWTIYAIIRGRLDAAQPPAEEPVPAEPMFGILTPVLAAQVPMSNEGLDSLKRDLRHGGLYEPTAPNDFRALRAVLVLFPLIAGGLVALAVEQDQTPMVLAYTAVATILGYALPRVLLEARTRRRTRQIERGLPLAVDLLTLCLSAGQNLLAALTQVSRELSLSNPVLASELAITVRHTELHSLSTAMRMWADRAGSPEVTNLALILSQSEQLGSDVGVTLQEMAVNLRTTSRQRAEAQANRTSFWMLFPTIFCFWIAAAIVLIGPPYVDFFQKQRESAESIGRTIQDGLDRANNPKKLRSARSARPTGEGNAPR